MQSFRVGWLSLVHASASPHGNRNIKASDSVIGDNLRNRTCAETLLFERTDAYRSKLEEVLLNRSSKNYLSKLLRRKWMKCDEFLSSGFRERLIQKRLWPGTKDGNDLRIVFTQRKPARGVDYKADAFSQPLTRSLPNLFFLQLVQVDSVYRVLLEAHEPK